MCVCVCVYTCVYTCVYVRVMYVRVVLGEGGAEASLSVLTSDFI